VLAVERESTRVERLVISSDFLFPEINRNAFNPSDNTKPMIKIGFKGELLSDAMVVFFKI
jgi:hypothetical protein